MLNSTLKRLQALEQMLQWEVGFVIHHPSRDGTEYCIERFIPQWYKHFQDEPVLVTFPYCEYLDGGGCGGSYTPLPKAAKKILKLIRDYHDVIIDDIWTAVQNMPNRKGQEIVLAYPETEALMEHKTALWGGTVFVGGIADDELAELNEKMAAERSEALDLKNSTLGTILSNIPQYQEARRRLNQWDTDDDLSLKPKVEPGRSVYIKDIIQALAEDSVTDLQQYLDLPYYRTFFYEAEVPEYQGDDYGGSRRDTSALICCAYSNSHQCMQALLERKANPNYQNDGGSTALHIAGRYGYIDCVKLLLEAGIDVHLKEKDGMTAYDRCMIRKEHQCAELIRAQM